MSRAWRDVEKMIGQKNLFFHKHLNRGKEEVNVGILDKRAFPNNGTLRIALEKFAPLTLMLGVTGCGKSKGLIGILQQFILLRQPFTLIDPTGSILRELVAFFSELLHFSEIGVYYARNEFERQIYLDWMTYLNDQVMILDFSGEFGEVKHCFNPLYCPPERPKENPEFVVTCLMRSCARQFGSMDQMRRLLNVLGAAATIAAEEGETLFRIPQLIGMRPNEFEQVVNKLDVQAARKGQQRIFSEYHVGIMNELVMPTSGRERRDLVQSTRNLLNALVSKNKFRKFIDCKGNEPWALDFHQILNGDGQGGLGHTMLVHLPNSDLDFVRVMGNLIITRIEQQARLRTPKERKKPYFLVVDEMALTVDQGTAEAASIIRQLGLRMILAGQSSQQPPFGTSEEGRAIFNTLVSQAWTKILYRLDIEDARRFAPYIHLANGEMEKKRFLERTQTSSASFGKQTTSKLGIEYKQGVDISQGAKSTVQESIGVSVTDSQETRKSKGTNISIARSFEENSTRTQGSEERKSESTEASTHISLSSGISHERSNSQSRSNSKNHSSSTVKQDICEDQGNSSREVRNQEKSNNKTSNHTSGESTKQSENRTSGNTMAHKQSTQTAHNESFSRGTREGIERREGESHQAAHVKANSSAIKREGSFGESLTQGVAHKQGVAIKSGLDSSQSEQNSQGTQTREVGGFHTLEQTQEIIAHWLFVQPDRQCYVTQKPSTEHKEGELAEGKLLAIQMQTHTIGDKFLSEYFQKNLVQAFLNSTNRTSTNNLPLASTPTKDNETEQVQTTHNSQTMPTSTDLFDSDSSEEKEQKSSGNVNTLPDELDL